MTPTTPMSYPDRLRTLQFNAALAVMAGEDMEVLDAAATLESAADLLGDALAVCRWVAVLGSYSLPPPFEQLARDVVRRADAANAGGDSR